MHCPQTSAHSSLLHSLCVLGPLNFTHRSFSEKPDMNWLLVSLVNQWQMLKRQGNHYWQHCNTRRKSNSCIWACLNLQSSEDKLYLWEQSSAHRCQQFSGCLAVTLWPHCVHRGLHVVSMFSSTSHDDKAHWSVSLCARSPGLQHACHTLSPGAFAKGAMKGQRWLSMLFDLQAAGLKGRVQMWRAVVLRQGTVRPARNKGWRSIYQQVTRE